MISKTKKVDEVFATWDKPDSPGCALAVMKDGEVIYKRGYGMANLEYGISITPTTIFHVASVSKQFTAMAVAILASEGKLSLDDNVRKHVQELPDFGEIITIRHLVHHTSGLRDQWALLVAAGWRMDDVITTGDVMELVREQRELNFEPGSEFLYCNTGYTLMAVIVERVSGKSFREFCAKRIFQPLGMDNTHFHDDHRMIVRNRAYSYAPKEENGFQHSVLSYATAGATSLFTTVEDLARWDQNFYGAAVGGKAVIEQMRTRGVLNDGEQIRYAFGLNITEYRGLRVVEHSGGDAGYRSHLMRFPEQCFSVTILCNLSNMSPSKLTRSVADIYLAHEFPDKKAEEDIIKLSEEQLASKVGVYYNAATASTRRFEMREGKLVATFGPDFELLPLAEDHFKLAAYPIEFRFTRSTEDGSLQLHQVIGRDKPVIYEAVTPVTLTKEEKAAYTGNYHSPELDVSYNVMLQDDQLVLKRRKHDETPLLPTIPDGFSANGVNLFFSRDERNNVSGFRLSSGRIRNLLFVRKKH
ncbi:MAG: beta-lactamase family protein [Candidatus Bathyarchaeota archaeon]|nr:MAG: beta-lactamase family protein [Candidatus Bathyarchaeota archaeon]